MFIEEESKLLGLTTKEKRLLDGLSATPINVSDLARTTKIKRTSLYSLLEHLLDRGLASKTRLGRRWYWYATPAKQLQEKLFSLAENHRATDETREHEVGIIASQESEYKIYRGKNKLITIYKELANLPRHSRLYGIQPNISVRTVLKHLPEKDLVIINESFKKRNIIVEALLQEDFLTAYADILKPKKKSGQDILQSYGNRLAITTYIPSGTLNFDSEILFYGNIVLFMNWQELVAIVIKNKDMVGIMKALFELAKLSGNRVDQNPQVERLLNK